MIILKNQTVIILEEDCFGQIIEAAEAVGWEDTHGDAQAGNWTPKDADDCVEDALNYLTTQGTILLAPDQDAIEPGTITSIIPLPKEQTT